MKLRKERQGESKTIYYVVLDGGSCPASDFMENLEISNLRSHKTMTRRLKNHADNGPSPIREHESSIKGYGNLWEFKTGESDRLVYFDYGNGKTVVTHGFHSTHQKHQYKKEYGDGAALRDEILGEGQNDD